MKIMETTETMPLDASLSSVPLVTFVNENLSQLYELWKKKLLPHNILIVGASRREYTKESWLEHLGDYPEEFCYWMDFICCDLD